MSLNSRFREMEAKTGETTPSKDRGVRIRRCPKCGKMIRVPACVTDYIHNNCFTKDDFNHSLLATQAISFAGMRIEKGKKVRGATKTQDRSFDKYIKF